MKCYKPMEISDIAEENTSFGQLHTVQDRLPKGDIVIMIGHFNAKASSDNSARNGGGT